MVGGLSWSFIGALATISCLRPAQTQFKPAHNQLRTNSKPAQTIYLNMEPLWLSAC